MRWSLWMMIFASSLALADTFTTTPVIDGTRKRTGFPFPTFTFDSTTGSLRASFTQSASSGLQVFITEYFLSMEFSLPSLPAGFVVTGANVSWVETSDFLLPGNQHPMYGYVGNGSLESTDFFGGTLLAATVSNGLNDGRVSFDVTSYVSSRYQAGDLFVGFSIQNAGYYQTQSGTFPFFSTFTEVGTYQLAGRLAGDPLLRPTLTITAVPEASSWVLAAVGTVGFVMHRRRSR